MFFMLLAGGAMSGDSSVLFMTNELYTYHVKNMLPWVAGLWSMMA